ncbi:unknown [Tannerella sp. CAG:118]|uniref:Uncharacterized protein n=1 Tax=Coprobacter secundus subsp. similis TaxID=2751153 RepID=A0A7G1HTE9_9BACT|nr:hypothetical protein Cop2CBH44_13820 [Coprobacter secundus subsp. similis]CCY37705.1 unknown [Tannerella sp. CAG:118]
MCWNVWLWKVYIFIGYVVQEYLYKGVSLCVELK